MMRRLLRGILANAYGQGVAIGVQLVSVPAFIHAWGTERYGLWLVLSALPAALALADCGMTVTSGNAMTAAVARGATEAAARLFAQAVRFVSIVVFACACTGVLVVLSVPAAWIPLATIVSPAELKVAALALLGTTLSGLGLTVLDTAFRANRDYAFGFSGVTTIRLIEAVGALTAATLGGGIAIAASVMLALRLAGLILFAGAVKRRVSWVRFSQPETSWRELRPLVRPAVAALAIPAALAVGLQGMTLVAAFVLPLALVPVFAATRTLTRTLVQAIGLFTHALMPEMARAAGRGDQAAVRKILRLNGLIGAATLLPGWVALVAIGPWLMRRWTGAQVDVEPVFFSLMATAALCHGAWMSSANLLLATNRQSEYSYAFLVAACVSCLAALLLGSAAGLTGMAVATLASEALMVCLVLPKGLASGAFAMAPTLHQRGT